MLLWRGDMTALFRVEIVTITGLFDTEYNQLSVDMKIRLSIAQSCFVASPQSRYLTGLSIVFG